MAFNAKYGLYVIYIYSVLYMLLYFYIVSNSFKDGRASWDQTGAPIVGMGYLNIFTQGYLNNNI